jgi:hypothetical protein
MFAMLAKIESEDGLITFGLIWGIIMTVAAYESARLQRKWRK